MTQEADWLPSLVFLDEHGGNWAEYEDAIYSIFEQDFILSRPVFRGVQVNFIRHPMANGKVATFWHITSEGKQENERTQDLRRCERIGWVRAIIEHADVDDRVRVWQNESRGDKRICLWYEDEDYIVILGARGEHYVLVTGYPISHDYRRAQLKREFESYWAKNG